MTDPSSTQKAPDWVADLKIKDAIPLQRAIAFLQNITKDDVIAVLHDNDGDGLSAAAVIAAGVEHLRGKEPEWVEPFEHCNTYISDDLPEKLRKMGVTKVITADKSVDQKGTAFMQRLEQVAPILVIDHHTLYESYQSEKFILFKPQIVWETEPSSFPTSMMAYTLFSYITDLSPKDWISCIGIVSDSAYPRWKKFVDATAKKWELEPVTNDDPFSVSFGYMSRMIYSTQILSANQLPEFLELLTSSNHPQKVLDSGFNALVGIVDDEVNACMDRLKTEINVFPELELAVAKISPRHSVKSLVINRLSRERYPNYTVLLMQDLRDTRVLISARRQDFKVPVNKLMEQAIVDLPDSNGGGHIPAAAASIRKEDEAQFLTNVKKILSEKLLE